MVVLASAVIGGCGTSSTKTGLGQCHSSQLAARIGRTGVALGSVGIAVELRNVSPTHCTLDGRPTLELVNAKGMLMPAYDRAAATTVSPVRARLVSLAPGGIAYFVIWFADGTGFSHTCPTSARARLIPPHDRTPIDVRWQLDPFGSSTRLGGCGGMALSPVMSKDTITLPPSPWRKAAASTRVT